MDSVIWNILIHHGEEEWLDKCRAALPGVSDGEILGVIQGGFKDQVHTWTLSICKETNQILVGEVAAIHPAFMWPSGLAPMEYAG